MDPKSIKSDKRYWRLDWVLTLWGARGLKAECKYADEIDPRSLIFHLKAKYKLIQMSL